MTHKAISLIFLLIGATLTPVFGTLHLAPGGVVYLAPSGSVTLVGVNAGETPTPPADAWLTATMTSNVDPSPNAVTDTTSGTNPWEAFDQNYTTYFDSQTGTTGDITYDFGAGNSETATSLWLKNVSGAGANAFVFAGSNDDSSYDTLVTDNGPADDTRTEYSFSNTTAYRYYKLTWSSSHFGAFTRIYEIEIRG